MEKKFFPDLKKPAPPAKFVKDTQTALNNKTLTTYPTSTGNNNINGSPSKVANNGPQHASNNNGYAVALFSSSSTSLSTSSVNHASSDAKGQSSTSNSTASSPQKEPHSDLKLDTSPEKSHDRPKPNGVLNFDKLSVKSTNEEDQPKEHHLTSSTLGRQLTWPTVARSREAVDSSNTPTDMQHTQSHENDPAHLVVVRFISIFITKQCRCTNQIILYSFLACILAVLCLKSPLTQQNLASSTKTSEKLSEVLELSAFWSEIF
jgi:hypothetical protein